MPQAPGPPGTNELVPSGTLAALLRLSYWQRLLGRSQRWRSQAACAGMGPDLFFPAGEQTTQAVAQTAAAKAVCAGCPVRLHCLVWALAANAESGVWGGWSPGERQGLRRERVRRYQARMLRAAARRRLVGALPAVEGEDREP